MARQKVNPRSKHKGGTPMVGVRFDPELREKLEREARQHERDLSWIIRAYCEAGLGLRAPVPRLTNALAP